jgi:mannosyltransferase
LSFQTLRATTAGINPALFSDTNLLNRKNIYVLILLFMVLGFGLRVWNLGAESLGEDELNKLQTVAEYRTNGITGRNGEHPFLMKGLQTVSLIAAEKLNNLFPNLPISEEAALRFPTALFGSLTVLLLYLLLTELFGSTLGLITAALWAVNPTAIGFDRIAKEDSFLLFFFLLANVFWLRGQTVAETQSGNPKPYYWATAAAFGAMVASKYLVHLLGITAAYYFIFQAIPSTNWRLGKIRWLKFFVMMGLAFVICNPTILLPETWRQMLIFSGEKRIGHDAYEYMGQLYRNQLTLWLTGVPWTFYYVFILVKTPILTLGAFLVGVLAMWRRKMGDGRYFIFFWVFLWFMPFTVLGGKFTRYFAVPQPLIFIFAAVGICFIAKVLATYWQKSKLLPVFQMALLALVTISSLLSSVFVAPHYRLFTNDLGGGNTMAGFYFPHDEFYDLSSRETVAEIAQRANFGAKIACETPLLMDYYAQKIGRTDLQFVSLSDREKVQSLAVGDFIMAASGRRYFSNAGYLNLLKNSAAPIVEIKVNKVISVRLYQLDNNLLTQIQALETLPK